MVPQESVKNLQQRQIALDGQNRQKQRSQLALRQRQGQHDQQQAAKQSQKHEEDAYKTQQPKAPEKPAAPPQTQNDDSMIFSDKNNLDEYVIGKQIGQASVSKSVSESVFSCDILYFSTPTVPPRGPVS